MPVLSEQLCNKSDKLVTSLLQVVNGLFSTCYNWFAGLSQLVRFACITHAANFLGFFSSVVFITRDPPRMTIMSWKKRVLLNAFGEVRQQASQVGTNRKQPLLSNPEDIEIRVLANPRFPLHHLSPQISLLTPMIRCFIQRHLCHVAEPTVRAVLGQLPHQPLLRLRQIEVPRYVDRTGNLRIRNQRNQL